MPRRLTYLPALDGLRAIAVIMVVAYHLEFSWASGGFLGVDVFFVISGYLITRLLLDEHGDSGTIALGRFWTRRFRRLVPAMLVMIATTLAATHRWGLPEQWRSIRVDALAAIAYVANWRFIVDEQSYFDASLGPSPLLHTWSLAVEEQWYLIWPIAMTGLCVVAARRGAGAATAVVASAALASAVWMAALYDPSDPSRVYFGTDTRAQQLLVGAALAWLVHRRPSIAAAASRPLARVPLVGALGILVAVAATVHDDADWLYRGGLLAISLLAAFVVLGTTTAAGSGLSALAWAPLVWIGRRSYGIYLWHFPVIAFADPATGGDLTRWQLVALELAVTLALTELSLRIVETPARRSTAPPVRTITIWTAAAVAIGAIGFVALVPPASRDLARSDAVFLDLDDLPGPLDTSTDARPGPSTTAGIVDDGGRSSTGSETDRDEDGSGGDPNATGTTRLLLFGDSAAYTLAEQLELPDGSAWDVQALAKLGCPTTPGVTIDAGSSRPNPVDAECEDWVDLWPEYARVLEPDVVAVMVGAWEVLDHVVDDEVVRFPSAAWDDLVRSALVADVEAAASSGAPVVLVQVPCMAEFPDATARADRERVDAVNRILRNIADGSDDVTVAALSPVVCPTGDPDYSVDGVPVRYDGVHYTRAGAALVWPWLLDELGDVLEAR